LATHGQHITMIEQNSLIFMCLNFLLNIVKHDHPDEKVYQQLKLINENSVEFLSSKDTGFADCLYLDPMFPAHKSSARPGKELQILQLLTSNLNIEALFELALQKAKYRVVVKRPIHATTLSDRKPDIIYKEKTIRFDVYLTNNF
ncbi:MAG: class I SAM-dependent methyltransferase, partial [Thiotrichaceae bacterium]|nr:class I SAM-dependent methyltransferase [Thiotrichaceae bacterium]